MRRSIVEVRPPPRERDRHERVEGGVGIATMGVLDRQADHGADLVRVPPDPVAEQAPSPLGPGPIDRAQVVLLGEVQQAHHHVRASQLDRDLRRPDEVAAGLGRIVGELSGPLERGNRLGRGSPALGSVRRRESRALAMLSSGSSVAAARCQAIRSGSLWASASAACAAWRRCGSAVSLTAAGTSGWWQRTRSRSRRSRRAAMASSTAPVSTGARLSVRAASKTSGPNEPPSSAATRSRSRVGGASRSRRSENSEVSLVVMGMCSAITVPGGSVLQASASSVRARGLPAASAISRLRRDRLSVGPERSTRRSAAAEVEAGHVDLCESPLEPRLAARGEEEDRIVVDPVRHEPDHVGRRCVQPLQIVDEQYDGPLAGRFPHQVERSEREEGGFHHRGRGAPERGRDGLGLRTGQRVGVVEQRFEQRDEARIGEPGLGRDGEVLDDLVPHRPGVLAGRVDERALSDARIADEDERTAFLLDRVDAIDEETEQVSAADQVRGHAPFPSEWARHVETPTGAIAVT